MRDIEYAWQGNGYFTPTYGVYRWGILTTRPGTYRVVAMPQALALIRMTDARKDYDHPTCVVDDFGDLVPVGEMK